MSAARNLSVAFPTSLIFENSAFTLNPANLESTYQYYFLENVSSPLIEDDETKPTGYKGQIALDWRFTGKNEIDFVLNPDARWSDGSPITSADITRSFTVARKKKHRHLDLVLKFSAIRVHGDGKIISFVYPGPINESILHEFSLADSAIISYDKKTEPDWRRTSGYYFVKTANEGSVVLHSNPYKSASSQESPNLVRLERVSFSSKAINSIDFFAPQAWLFRSEIESIRSSAEYHYDGMPTVIHYFEILRDIRGLRKIFASDVRTFQKAAPSISDEFQRIAFETQMVPPGYIGRIDESEVFSWSQKSNLTKRPTLLVIIEPNYSRLSSLFERLRTQLEKHFQVTISTNDINKENYDLAAYLRPFKGNMKDPKSSWNFLFSTQDGPLSRYKSSYLEALQKIETSLESTVRLKNLVELHKAVLENSDVVPFIIEAPSFLSRKKMDFSNINRFDLRLRFYQLLIKE